MAGRDRLNHLQRVQTLLQCQTYIRLHQVRIVVKFLKRLFQVFSQVCSATLKAKVSFNKASICHLPFASVPFPLTEYYRPLHLTEKLLTPLPSVS